MKKILLFLLIILLPAYLFGESGDGKTVISAYYGTISTTQTWTYAYNSGIIYVGQSGNPDLTISSGGNLSIEAGVTVIFCTTSTDLIITGTGTLTADGTPSNKITFTRDSPTINYWGHISFESMGSAGTSVFDNCIIEYGDVTSFSNSDPHGGGGGIFIDFNDVSITNCIFQHNKSQWGGGIFVYKTRYPTIKNCNFYDNSAKEAGGGIFLWDYASSVIENCIFYSNSCQGTSGYSGGGLAALSSCYIQVVNCTFTNNTSSITDGQGLLLSYSSGSKVVNSIFWGSDNQVYLASGTNGNTIINCAIQAGVPSGSVNCITLNSSNTASDGPNFTATNGTDWSIKFISPCRDAGTTPSPTIPNDYIGNPRIGPYDIGAYEVQYSRWTGVSSTNWLDATNWDQSVDPGTGTGDVIIPSGLTLYPTIIPAKNFTLGSGKIMILNPGAKTTLNTLTNNGTLKLESDASNIASLIVTKYNDNGNEEIELYLTGGGSPDYKWHYISTPVSTTFPVITFTGVTQDIAGYFEARVTIDLLQGWIGYDGWIYASETPAYDYAYAFSEFVLGRGYDYYNDTDIKFTFSGTLNTADVSTTLTFKTGGDANLNGWNLLGNPFSSGFDWDIIAGDAGFPASTSKSIYFTRDKSLCSYINHVGSPGDVSGIIPPMQGFFTKTYDADHTIVLSTAARTHASIHARYKGKSDIPLVRLSIAENSKSDETVVRFDESAKSNLDNDFDAVKMFTSPDNLLIYSAVSGIKYVINGQPFPNTFVEIPIVVNLKQEGNHTITTTQLQGLDNYDVYFIDNSTGFTADLKTTPVLTFSASTGLISDRFILKVVNVVTGTEDPLITSKSFFNIYQATNMINIQTISDEWDGKRGSVRILDLTGRTITDQQNTEFSRNSIVQVPGTGLKGMYVVEIRAGALRYVGKVVIR